MNTDTQQPDKPTIFVNASALKQGSCKLKLQRVITGLQAKAGGASDNGSGDYKMAYGTAFHLFAQKFYGVQDVDDDMTKDLLVSQAIDAALENYQPYVDQIPADDDLRTLAHLDNTCHSYAQSHRPGEFVPIKLDDKPALEVKFAWPVKSHDLFDLCLAGTLDMVATKATGGEAVIDHKTTSHKSYKMFLDGFLADLQAKLYVTMERRLSGRNYWLPFIVNGIFLRKGCADFQRKEINFTDDEMLVFEEWLDQELERIYQQLCEWFVGGVRASNDLTQCKQFYGMCQYWNICKFHGDMARNVERSLYERVPYLPLETH